MARTNLKVFRVKHRMSQDEMSQKIGCTRSTYSAIEGGRRNGRKVFWNDLQTAFSVSNEEMWELMANEEE